jgi:Ca2+-binding RTX toxin-like protein
VTGLGGSLAVAGIALSLLALPAAAEAGFVSRSGSNVVFIDDVDEVNDLVVGFASGSHTFQDVNAIAPGPGCTQDMLPPTVVHCPAQNGDAVTVNLVAENDEVTMTSSVEFNACGGTGDDTLTGGPGADFLLGEEGSDTIVGGDADDFALTEVRCNGTMPSTPSSNDASGDGGDDALIGGNGIDNFTGGEGSDTLLGARAESGVGSDEGDILEGDGGPDRIVGHHGNDLLDGGDGPDTLVGGEGNDNVFGRDGDDQLGGTVNQSFGGGNSLVTRDPGQDVLDGGPGDDLLNGGPGATVLNFGLQGAIDPQEVATPNGPDDLIGGPGRDTVSYVNLTLAVQGTLDSVANDGTEGEGDNIRADNEALTGGSGADRFTGSPQGDAIDGGKGADIVDGGGGDDTLAGGADDGGADNLAGGDGADSVDGGPGDDLLAGQAGTDTVGGGSGNDLAGGGDDADRVSGGAGLDSVSGGLGNDRLLGGADGLVGADGADQLSGDEGDDELDGGAGDDSLAGGLGDDVMAGAEGLDLADYRTATGAVTARLDGAPGDGAAGENDHIRADVEGLRGGRGADTFTGSSAANVIFGGGGADYVDGARGRDNLDGGDGSDALRSRDGADDRVACGRRRDFAIADAGDRVRGCEIVDRGGRRRRPAVGRAMLVRPGGGATTLRVAGTQRFIPLRDALRVPLRSTVDATDGAVRLITAGSRSSATLSGGLFGVRQRRKRHAPTVLRLAGASFRACTGAAVVRRLRGSGRGLFRIVGRRSTTAIRRASWVVEDRCNGTLTRVRRGRARVFDRGRRRPVVVRSGKSYLARAR